MLREKTPAVVLQRPVAWSQMFFGLMLVQLSETLTCHEMWLLCVILCLLVSCYLLPALKLSHHSTNAKELAMPQCCNPNNQGEVCHGRKVIGSLLGQLEAGQTWQRPGTGCEGLVCDMWDGFTVW